MMVNRYPGTCYRCGRAVAAGEGRSVHIRWGGWKTMHAECEVAYRDTETRNGRRPVDMAEAQRIHATTHPG